MLAVLYVISAKSGQKLQDQIKTF